MKIEFYSFKFIVLISINVRFIHSSYYESFILTESVCRAGSIEKWVKYIVTFSNIFNIHVYEANENLDDQLQNYEKIEGISVCGIIKHL